MARYNGQTYEVTKEKWFVLYAETVYVNPASANPVLPYDPGLMLIVR